MGPYCIYRYDYYPEWPMSGHHANYNHSHHHAAHHHLTSHLYPHVDWQQHHLATTTAPPTAIESNQSAIANRLSPPQINEEYKNFNTEEDNDNNQRY